LLIAAYRTPELGFDYQGVLVGALTLLVTILIGWQIYTFIDINKKAEKLSLLITEASLNTERCLAISEDAASGIYYYLLLKSDHLGLEYQFLYHRVSSLLHTSNFGDTETCNSIVKAMLEMMVKPEKIEMIQSCKDRLLVLLTNVKNTGKITGYGKLVEKVAKITVVPNA
jgi:hypothetical protein